jgi:hypothetical protein
LQAHGGDVRCGRCAEIFNAFSTLSTIKEPETSGLDQGKAEETPEESSKYPSKDESPAPGASAQQMPPASRHEPSPTEARAEAGVEAVTETSAPGARLQETTPWAATSPIPVHAETKAPGAVTQASATEAVNLEAEIQKAEIPEATVSAAAMTEASEAQTASSGASLQQSPASEAVPPLAEPTAERSAAANAAMEQFAAESVTDTAGTSKRTTIPGVREPETPGPKADQRKMREPGKREDRAQKTKAHAEQPRAKAQPQGEQGEHGEHRQQEEQGEGDKERKNRETQERKPERTPDHEIPPASYAFDEAVANISPAWTFGSLLLLILLTGQTIYFYRAELAALVPAARPYLEQYCELLQCSISLPRHPQSLNIESSEMQSAPLHPNVITLNATVRNHASYPQAFPLFELTFIDNQNRPLASRIFKPEIYLGENAGLAENVSPGNEFNVRLHLDTGDLNAAGYRLSLLYPNS